MHRPTPQTINVWIGDEDTHMRYKFHCPVCGNVVAEVNGKIRHMMRGDMESRRAITVMCKGGSDRCGSMFVFYS